LPLSPREKHSRPAQDAGLVITYTSPGVSLRASSTRVPRNARHSPELSHVSWEESTSPSKAKAIVFWERITPDPVSPLIMTTTSDQHRMRATALTILVLLFPILGYAAPADPHNHWVGSWAASQQLVEPGNALSPDDLRDCTLRQIVHLSLGGTKLRVHLSNRFGTAPLRFAQVHVARGIAASSSRIDAATERALTFSGRAYVTVPAGADYVSDPIDFRAPPFSDVAITLYVEIPPAEQTGHPGSRATSYMAHGDLVSAADLADAKKVEHWYFISGIDVDAPAAAAAVVALGDSITDGHGATTDANNRWPDVLARRLHANSGTREIAVLNQGIGGNRLLLDGLGPNALARFDHDVVAPAGVRYLIVLEGINDIGTLSREHEVPATEHESLVHRMLAAYEQIVARAHAHRIQVIGATILPFVGSGYYHPSAAAEADRQAVNKWIRAPGHFDAVIDLDNVTRDPAHPERLRAAFDSGDHLHPSPAGYSAMADAVSLALFASK
jgi:lysophospholipase L1-like esterase